MNAATDTSSTVPAVIVLYDFSYSSKDKREISVHKGEKLYLLEKTNQDWWQVIRNSERRSFYVPAQYVEEIRRGKQHPGSKNQLDFMHDEGVEYENLNSFILKHQEELPSLSHITRLDAVTEKDKSTDVSDLKKAAQDVSKQKPVPKTRTKVSVRKNSYENTDIVKSSKSALSTNVDKNDKTRFGKITEDLSFSLPRNSDQLSFLQSDKGSSYPNKNVASSDIINTKIEGAGSKSDIALKQKSKISSKIDVDNGKNRMKNSYNLKVKSSRSFDYHQVSASNFERKQSVPLMKNEKLKLCKNLSRSLEKLAEEIKFEPKIQEKPTGKKGTTPRVENYSNKSEPERKMDKKGKTDDASIVLDETRNQQPRASVFGKLVRSLNHTSSFKAKNKRKLGKNSKQVCELSLSWEGGLEKIDEREEKSQVTMGGLQRSQTFMIGDRSPMGSRQNRLFPAKNRLDIAYHAPAPTRPQEKATFITFKPKITAKEEPTEKEKEKEKKTEEIRPPTSPKNPLAFYNKTFSENAKESDKSLKSQTSVDSNITSEGTELSESDDNGSVDFGREKSSKSPDDQLGKRRTSLVRSKRVESSKAILPPTPKSEERPMRDLGEGWGAYSSEGRCYYYNENTGEKNWKPPRRKLTGQEKQLDGSRESIHSDISSSLTRSNTSSPLNDRCHLSNPSLNRSNASLNSRYTYFDQSSFDRPKSGSACRFQEESPEDLNRCSYNSSPVTGHSRSSSYSLNKSSRDSLNRFSPVENIPSEEEGFELNDHIYQDGAAEKKEESLEKSDFPAAAPPQPPHIPSGWQECYDNSNEQFFLHTTTKQKWYSSHDNEGRIYYFRENSSESSWALPDLTPEEPPPETNFGIQRSSTESAIAKSDSSAKRRLKNGDKNALRVSLGSRSSKAQSMVFEPKLDLGIRDGNKAHSMPRDLSKTFEDVIRKGPLNKTKLAENGKKLRKNWTQAFVVLTKNSLIFLKDSKSFENMKNGIVSNGNYTSISLIGASLEKGDKISSRKNVYKINSLDNTEILIQTDKTAEAEEWCRDISFAIQKLPQELCNSSSSSSLDPSSPSKVGRTKSLKVKSKETGSMEDLSSTPEERQNKIKARLKKFFVRRPTVESLRKRGILKDEPVFGCSLEQITKKRIPRVPAFVEECVKVIEGKEENMKTDGLYRASGNLSQVQKIRLEVDQNNLAIMKEEEDVHVLTGSLKLFFRELKEPLVPFKQLKTALDAADNHSRKDKIKEFQKIVKSLPTPNYDTLKFLLQHLLRVKEYHEYNRMNISNLAIVFGPTLMWPEQEYANMALDLMQQNVVIECLLNEFSEIFT